jgi:hypothetical protein
MFGIVGLWPKPALFQKHVRMSLLPPSTSQLISSSHLNAAPLPPLPRLLAAASPAAPLLLRPPGPPADARCWFTISTSSLRYGTLTQSQHLRRRQSPSPELIQILNPSSLEQSQFNRFSSRVIELSIIIHEIHAVSAHCDSEHAEVCSCVRQMPRAPQTNFASSSAQ